MKEWQANVIISVLFSIFSCMTKHASTSVMAAVVAVAYALLAVLVMFKPKQ